MIKKKILNTLKKQFVITAYFFSTVAVYGQADFFEGYVIDNSSDTIYGLIKLESSFQNSHECTFKKETGSKVIKYLPSDILGYRFTDGKYYVSETVKYELKQGQEEESKHVEFNRIEGKYYPKDESLNGMPPGNMAVGQEKEVEKQVFVEYLINGNVDVYVYYYKPNNPLYFVKKGGDSLIYLENTTGVIYNQYEDDYFAEKKEYVGVLSYLLHDCEGIQSKVADTKLDKESLIRLAKYYHNQTCDNPNEECVVYEKKNRKILVSIIPVINYSKLEVSSSDLKKAFMFDIENQNHFSYGIKFKFSNFQYLNYHLSARSGILFHNQYFETGDELASIEFKVLEIPLELYYSVLPKSKIKPYLGLAVCPYFRVKKDVNIDYYVVIQPEIRTLNAEFAGIMGLDYHFNEKFFITTSVQYKIGGPFYDYTHTHDNSRSNSLLFQVGFGCALLNE